MSSNESFKNSMPADRASLHIMTKLKLDRFKQQKHDFDKRYTEILQKINQNQISSQEKLKILIEGIRELYPPHVAERYLSNISALLDLSEANTSTSDDLLKNFAEQYMEIIEGGKKRADYNYLLGSIMSEWSSRSEQNMLQIGEDLAPDTKDAILTNERLEQIIFDRLPLDSEQWRQFLRQKVFINDSKNPTFNDLFESFKQATCNYGTQLLAEKTTPEEIHQAMKRLMSNKSLTEHRKRALEKLSMDDNAVAEFASCCTLLKSSLGEWNWPKEGVRGIFRRNLPGRYRCFYEEDFLTAIFLENLGLKWSAHFKKQLRKLFSFLTENQLKDCQQNSIESNRISMQQTEYWMVSLPDGTEAVDSYTDDYSSSSQKVGLKERLLHLIDVEIQLHQTLHPDVPFNVVCADFEWFGPSMSHEIIGVLLEECGMPKLWLTFFDRFLKQIVFYKPNEPLRQRQRGVPISHSLSYLFCELFLFGMDLYVYRSTGIFNYRLHDDLLLFGSDPSKVEEAWALMNDYATLTGMKFNKEKCGSVQITAAKESQTSEETTKNRSLPNKEVQWGLLTLKPNGRFIIDHELLKPVLDEMKERLNQTTIVLEWVNIYNRYIGFFMRNFGQCSNGLGEDHLLQIKEAFQFIHRYVFDQTDGNALTVLSRCIQKGFSELSIDDIPEGWFYWPLTKGGLGLKNIYLDLYGLMKKVSTQTDCSFASLPNKDIQMYEAELRAYNQSQKNHFTYQPQATLPFLEVYIDTHRKFMPWEEFIAHRENLFVHWGITYTNMLTVTTPLLPDQSTISSSKLHLFEQRVNGAWTRNRRSERTPSAYMAWLSCYYGRQIESIFKQLDFVDDESLPMGLIKMVEHDDINWEVPSKGRSNETN